MLCAAIFDLLLCAALLTAPLMDPGLAGDCAAGAGWASGRDVTGVEPAAFLIETRRGKSQVAPSRASKNINLAQWLPEWAGYTEGG